MCPQPVFNNVLLSTKTLGVTVNPTKNTTTMVLKLINVQTINGLFEIHTRVHITQVLYFTLLNSKYKLIK